jgi:hypothetical protein
MKTLIVEKINNQSQMIRPLESRHRIGSVAFLCPTFQIYPFSIYSYTLNGKEWPDTEPITENSTFQSEKQFSSYSKEQEELKKEFNFTFEWYSRGYEGYFSSCQNVNNNKERIACQGQPKLQ